MKLNLNHTFSLCITLAASFSSIVQADPLYKDVHAPLEARVNDLFSQLTQDEKLSMLTGDFFTTHPIPRLGIPAMGMVDAGQGVRGGLRTTQGPATLFPAGVTMASTWDTQLVGQIGEAIGAEAVNKGTGSQVLLGPAVNIHRSPLGGRNGEYFSEDPYLASRLAVAYVEGMQSTGCASCVKHFACNNEEQDRNVVNVHVDERTLREIYLPAFEAATTEAHAWSIMSSYNLVNGFHSSANDYLLTDVLKKGWDWDGLVISDWGAVHETAGAINAGNDLEMPGHDYFTADKLAAALADGEIKQSSIDESIHRILRCIIRTKLLDGPMTPDSSVVNSPAHQHLAYKAACEGIVLLKNEGDILPLNTKYIKSIAVIGTAATQMQLGAVGSPGLTPFYSIQPLDGIRARAGAGIAINYAQPDDHHVPVPALAFSLPDGSGPGLKAEYFNDRDLSGTPAAVQAEGSVQDKWLSAPVAGLTHDNFSVRWTGKLNVPTSGSYTFNIVADDGSRLFIDGKRIIDYWRDNGGDPQTADVTLSAGNHDFRMEYYQAGGDAYAYLNWTTPQMPHFVDAVAAAKSSDVALVFVTTKGTDGEGGDRPSMDLPHDQNALISAVAAANKKTIVVINNGNPVAMAGWVDQVRGVVDAWFPGEEGGHAIASVLFGDVNPSGKLVDTIGARREDYPDYGHFPGTNNQVDYAEGIYVGYRHFDKAHIAPLYPFGYGLSYTTFKYSNLRLSSGQFLPNATVTVRVDITNTGKREGAEVAELYICDPSPKIDKAVRELKGFQKVDLMPGETKTVTLTLSPRAFAYCDVPGKQWKADAGVYDIELGASSRDIRQVAPVKLVSTFTQSIPFMGN